MKLTCPACGAVASADSWINDALCRDTLVLIAALPAPLPKAVLGYLSLFRPEKTGLTWKKAQRLVEEIKKLVACGYVGAQGKVDRDCPPRIWAQAMDQMVEKRTTLSLPIKSHNYLRQVAWQLADQEDARAEQNRQQTVRVGVRSETPHRFSACLSPLDQYIQGLRDTKPTDQEMKEWKNKHLK